MTLLTIWGDPADPSRTKLARLRRGGMDVIYAMVYEDTGDVVGTYPSRGVAEDKLAEFIAKHPHVQDEIGLRPYADGRPATRACPRTTNGP